MFLCLRSVAAVIPSRLLPLHPQVHQLLKLTHNKLSETRTHKEAFRSSQRLFQHLPYLQRQHHQSHTDHDDYQQLGGPYAGSDVSEAHGGEGDDAEVEGIEEGEVFACSLQVLDSTCAV